MIPFDYDQEDWGSTRVYPDGQLKPWNPDKFVIHWGGKTRPYPKDNPNPTLAEQVEHEMRVLRAWQGHHRRNGWVDIAYNYAVGNSGMAYRCRGENRSGATSGDYEDDGIPENHEARALVWIGGLGYEPPSGAAVTTMARMIQADITKPVTVHRDHKATACPGDWWSSWVEHEGWLLVPPEEEDDMATTVNAGDVQVKEWERFAWALYEMGTGARAENAQDSSALQEYWGVPATSVTQPQLDAFYGYIDLVSKPSLYLPGREAFAFWRRYHEFVTADQAYEIEVETIDVVRSVKIT